MPFEVTTVRNESIAELTLTGDLDGASAPRLMAELESLSKSEVKPNSLVLRVSGLTFLASAGIRILFFAKQTLFQGAAVYIVAPSEQALDTLQRTGADRGFLIVDVFPEPTA